MTESEKTESRNGTEANDVEEIRIVLKQEKETDQEETVTMEVSTESVETIPVTIPKGDSAPNETESEDQLKKIRIVLDVKEDGSNVTESNPVNTDDDNNTIKS